MTDTQALYHCGKQPVEEQKRTLKSSYMYKYQLQTTGKKTIRLLEPPEVYLNYTGSTNVPRSIIKLIHQGSHSFDLTKFHNFP